jgi:phosphoglycolate phosphatase
MSNDIKSGHIAAVLFDLDGGLVDTAPDLAAALNVVLKQHNAPQLPYSTIRPVISNGANGLIALGFGNQLTDDEQQTYKTQLIEYYQEHIADQSQLFDGLNDALVHLENNNIPWGIVTNKPAYLTGPLLHQLSLTDRAACIVCGDQVNSPKPHPESIYLACQQLGIQPQQAIYIGDAERDIRAGRLAGLKTIACRYGYIVDLDDIKNWQADLVVDTPTDLLESLLLIR